MNTSLWLPERSLGFARKAMVLPSADHEGEKHERVPSVKHRNSPACPSTIDNVYKSGHGSCHRSSPRLDVKAIPAPSGDHVGSLSSQSPSVSSFGSPPSISTRNRCW